MPEGVINDRWIARSWMIPLLRLGPINRLGEHLIKRLLARTGGMIAPPSPPMCDYRTPESHPRDTEAIRPDDSPSCAQLRQQP